METESATQSPVLREADRVVDNIREKYLERPLPFSGKEDAKRYIRSKLLYVQAAKDREFAEQEIETCKAVLKGAEAGEWNPMINEIRRIGVDFMNVPDPESARRARALFNLAFSISPNKTS